MWGCHQRRQEGEGRIVGIGEEKECQKINKQCGEQEAHEFAHSL